MLPWSFSEVLAAEKYMRQLQHNMWVIHVKAAVLSVITGGGKWAEITIPTDSLYQHLLLTAAKKFWRCVENGEPPRLFGIEPPRPQHTRLNGDELAPSENITPSQTAQNLDMSVQDRAGTNDEARADVESVVFKDGIRT